MLVAWDFVICDPRTRSTITTVCRYYNNSLLFQNISSFHGFRIDYWVNRIGQKKLFAKRILKSCCRKWVVEPRLTRNRTSYSKRVFRVCRLGTSWSEDSQVWDNQIPIMPAIRLLLTIIAYLEHHAYPVYWIDDTYFSLLLLVHLTLWAIRLISYTSRLTNKII